MTIETDLQSRTDSTCELCGSPESLNIFEVAPETGQTADECILICETCRGQVEKDARIDVHHWRCLNESMWSQVPAVQVMAWRMLNRLREEGWARDALEMLYLDDETLAWAKKSGDAADGDGSVKHVDSNGVKLSAGDNVTLIKDLKVKGAGFTAKRGTAVRGISLVPDNSEHIEGRVDGQKIVILTEFVKKSV